LEADVDEGGLHAGEHPRDAPLVDVARDAAGAGPLDVELRQAIVLEHRDPRLVRVLLHQHLAVHHGEAAARRRRRCGGSGKLTPALSRPAATAGTAWGSMPPATMEQAEAATAESPAAPAGPVAAAGGGEAEEAARLRRLAARDRSAELELLLSGAVLFA